MVCWEVAIHFCANLIIAFTITLHSNFTEKNFNRNAKEGQHGLNTSEFSRKGGEESEHYNLIIKINVEM